MELGLRMLGGPLMHYEVLFVCLPIRNIYAF